MSQPLLDATPTGTQPAFQRTILRDEVRQWVLDAICQGSLAPGTALGEVDLAGRMGISRTPLREALVGLERDGFVVSSPGRGFAVAPLLASEMAELYPLIGTLEAFAMRASPCPEAEQIADLRTLNDRLGAATSVAKALAMDEQWHRDLLSRCRNRKVLALLDHQKAQVRRLEFAFSRIVDDVATSVQQHGSVLDALDDGDIEEAARRLEAHWND